MREILFRGKRKDSGEWIEGIPIKTHIGTFISFDENPHYCRQYGYMEIDRIAMIDEKTVCQYTGLTDRNGRKIFEGDILFGKRYHCDWGQGGEFIPAKSVVKWNGKRAAFTPLFWWKKPDNDLRNYEVIGNIFDNPELIGGAEEHE